MDSHLVTPIRAAWVTFVPLVVSLAIFLSLKRSRDAEEEGEDEDERTIVYMFKKSQIERRITLGLGQGWDNQIYTPTRSEKEGVASEHSLLVYSRCRTSQTTEDTYLCRSLTDCSKKHNGMEWKRKTEITTMRQAVVAVMAEEICKKTNKKHTHHTYRTPHGITPHVTNALTSWLRIHPQLIQTTPIKGKKNLSPTNVPRTTYHAPTALL